MSKKLLWMLDFIGSDVPTPETSPEIPEEIVVLADTHFTIVRGEYHEIRDIALDFPYWEIAGHPANGRWIAASGDEIYIAEGEVVDDPLKVLKSLGIPVTQYARVNYDYILEETGHTF